MQNVAEQKLKLAAAAATALLLLQLLWGGGRLLFLSGPDPVLPVSSALQPGVVNYQGPTSASSEIVERPVFWQGRKAFVYNPMTGTVDDEQTTPASDDINKVKLLGLYFGDTPGVIVQLNGERHRVSVNESLEGWTLGMITANFAVFENGEDSRTVELQHAIPKMSSPAKKKARPDKSPRPAKSKSAEIDK